MRGSLKGLMTVLFCVSFFLTVVLNLMTSSVYSVNMRLNTQKTVNLVTSEQSRRLTDQLQSVKTAMYTFANREEIAQYLGAGQGYRARNNKNIQSMLSDIPRYIPAVRDVVLTAADGHTVMTSANMDIQSFILRYHLSGHQSAERPTGMTCVTCYPQTGGAYILAMTVPIQMTTGEGTIMALCTADSLTQTLEDGIQYAIYDHASLVYSNAAIPPAVEKVAMQRDMQANGSYGEWVYYPVKLTDWELLIQSPLDVQGTLIESELIRLNAVMLLIALLIELTLVLSIYKTIVTPVSMISRQSSQILSSTSQISLPGKSMRELRNLVDNINAMIRRTNQLTNEINVSKLRMMKMQIQTLKAQNMFLQAQINPHFLYNMLECICGIASLHGDTAIREMTFSLSLLYRYCLKSPESTLGDELDSIEIYKKIIQQRYRSTYQIRVDADQELYALSMPRMTLEPLVENAVQHGFEHDRTDVCFVSLHAALEENTLIIRIEDNGCGMETVKMDAINACLERILEEGVMETESIGIFNVAKRLHLVYGGKSGLRLTGNEHGGLTICLCIEYPTEI